MRHYFFRHQKKGEFGNAGADALAIAVVMSLLHTEQELAGFVVMFAPLGASSILIFGTPANPVAQPVNVIGGHLLAAAIGLALHAILPDQMLAAALSVAFTMAGMLALRVIHPPAGATSLIAFGSDGGMEFLFSPILLGALSLVALGVIYHRLMGRAYPLPLPHA